LLPSNTWPVKGALAGGASPAPPQVLEPATVATGTWASGGSASSGSSHATWGIVVVVLLDVDVVDDVEVEDVDVEVVSDVVVVTPGHVLVSSVQSARHVGKAPPAEPPGHVAPPRSMPSHCSAPSAMPLPHSGGAVVDVTVVLVELVVEVVATVVVTDVDVDGVVDVVVGRAHSPPVPHAAQQLGTDPTQEAPPDGARHCAALFLMLHFVLPLRVVRQQVTAPGRPHVERDAQRATSARQSAGRRPSATAPAMTAAAQCTKTWRDGAVSQAHCSSTSARTSAAALGLLHAASVRPGPARRRRRVSEAPSRMEASLLSDGVRDAMRLVHHRERGQDGLVLGTPTHLDPREADQYHP
jgi:hypothetical protein